MEGRSIGVFMPATWILMGLTLGAVFSGCKLVEPIRIGFVGGTSGGGADLGINGREGAQLAVELCNQAGGVSGRKVRLLVKDDEQNPEVAQQAVRELVAQGAMAIIGPMTSAMGVAVVPVANESEVVIVSPTVTTEALSGLDDYFFRVSSTTRVYASRNALYQLRQKSMRRVAAAYDLGNKSFTENWLDNFRKTFRTGGGEIIKAIGFQSGSDTSFLNVAKELLACQPDGILIVANSMDSALLCQQIRKLDAKLPITLSDWGATERLLELGGRAVEGVTVVQTFDRNCTVARYQAFREAYLKRFNREPGFPGVYAFDAATVILAALSRQKSGQSLKETILAVGHFEGLQSVFSFDAFGDVKRPQASISVVRDGKFVVLE